MSIYCEEFCNSQTKKIYTQQNCREALKIKWQQQLSFRVNGLHIFTLTCLYIVFVFVFIACWHSFRITIKCRTCWQLGDTLELNIEIQLSLIKEQNEL